MEKTEEIKNQAESLTWNFKVNILVFKHLVFKNGISNKKYILSKGLYVISSPKGEASWREEEK